MIHYHFVSCPDEKWSLYGAHLKSQWVVSPLLTKNSFLEKKSLSKTKPVDATGVWRASEFWEKLFRVSRPEWTLVSEACLQMMLRQWLSDQDVETEFQDTQLFLGFVKQFLPFYGDHQLLQDWLNSEERPSSNIDKWFQVTQEFWNHLGQEKKASASWAPALLKDQNLSEYLSTSTSYFFDLGADIQYVEWELVHELAESLDVHLVVPWTSWMKANDHFVPVYKKCGEPGVLAQDVNQDPSSKDSLPVKKTYSGATPLDEVRWAISQVQDWLDQGVSLNKIAVSGLDIELYWDMLQEFLYVQNLPVRKKSFTKANSLPGVQSLLSQLRLTMNEYDVSQVEHYQYGGDSSPKNYDQFRADYFNVFDQELLPEPLPAMEGHSKVTLSEFYARVFQFSSKEMEDVLEILGDQMIHDFVPEEIRSFSFWVNYLELLLSKVEIPQQQDEGYDESGLFVERLSHLELQDITHLIVLGCDQGRLQGELQTPVTFEDTYAIERDLGYYLERPESRKGEFEVRWISTKALQEVAYTHSHFDLSGSAKTASSFFLEQERQPSDSTVLGPLRASRWEQLQESALAVVESRFPHKNQQLVQQKWLLESSEESLQELWQGKPFHGSLSASSLTRLNQCAFLFYVAKVLKLEEERHFDLDMDALYRGQLLHAVAENYYKRGVKTKEELSKIYDEVLKERVATGPWQNFWRKDKEKLLMMLQNFLDYDQERRKNFPINPLGVELSLKGYVFKNNNQVELSSEEKENSWMIRGQIDRVDESEEGGYQVVDYKYQKSPLLKNFKSWVEQKQYQLMLYSEAVENGLVEDLSPGPVESSYYYFFKEAVVGGGFFEEDTQSFSATDRRRLQKVTEESKTDVFQKLKEQLAESLTQLERGNYPPVPKDPTLCERCSWRGSCRAPHLKG